MRRDRRGGVWGPPQLWLSAALWAVAALAIGFSFFTARENEYGRG